MNSNGIELDFDFLGYKIRFRPEDENSQLSAQQIVDYVRSEANQILDKSPSLDRAKLAVLLSLKLGEELLSLKQEFKESIENLQSSACSALQFIDDVTPKSI